MKFILADNLERDQILYSPGDFIELDEKEDESAIASFKLLGVIKDLPQAPEIKTAKNATKLTPEVLPKPAAK